MRVALAWHFAGRSTPFGVITVLPGGGGRRERELIIKLAHRFKQFLINPIRVQGCRHYPGTPPRHGFLSRLVAGLAGRAGEGPF